MNHRSPDVTRRGLMRAGLLAGAAVSSSSLLTACGKPEVTSTQGLQIASPDNPVKWPLHTTCR